MSFADSLSTMDEGCERAILVGIQLKGDDASSLTSSLEELARLTDTAGAEVVATTKSSMRRTRAHSSGRARRKKSPKCAMRMQPIS